MARPAGGLTVQAGAFRSAAQVYEPRRVYAELDAPVTVDSPLILELDRYRILLVPEMRGGVMIFRILLVPRDGAGSVTTTTEAYHAP